MVGIVQAPWKILVEVARLRDDYRSRLDTWHKENVAAMKRERESRAVLADRERRVGDLRREIYHLEKRLGSAAGAGRRTETAIERSAIEKASRLHESNVLDLPEPAPKRLRLTA